MAREEAEEAFFTDDYIILEDKQHSSEQEERAILIGKTSQERMLFIAFTMRDKKIRIISARDADKKEVLFYEKAVSFTKV